MSWTALMVSISRSVGSSATTVSDAVARRCSTMPSATWPTSIVWVRRLRWNEESPMPMICTTPERRRKASECTTRE